MRRLGWVGALGALAALVACGSDSESAFLEGRGGADAAAPGAPGSGAAPPPGGEKEIESDYEAPVATGSFVWIANPKSGRVALVNATTLDVRTVEAGNAPTYVASVPGATADTTVVLNVLSEDATVLGATATGITTKTIKTAKKANSLAFSADGRYAIAWADARKLATAAPKTEGFQDLTVMDLQTGVSTILAVGYRPVLVGFAADGLTAHAVTQDGVAIVEISASPKVVRNVAISNNPNDDPGTRDVFVTKDGASAYVRRDDSADITIVNLTTGARQTVTLGGNVTDLDLADTGDRAIGVVRDTAQVAVVPIANPTGFTTVTATGETIGSVSIAPGGTTALLYTNFAAVERVTILDINGAPALRTVKLYSPVLAAFPSPDAQHAVVLHDKTVGTAGAFSIVPVGQALPAKIVPTEATTTAVAVTNTRAVIAERGPNVNGVYLARMPTLMVERYPLASPPNAVGIMASANRAFVAQQHPEGRITFLDLDTGVARTLTGFELSSRVVSGSKP
jgi:hypothetical protein